MNLRLATLALLVGGLLTARPAPAQTTTIGKVDTARVIDGYAHWQTLLKDHQAGAQQLVNRVQLWKQRYPLLLEEEFNQLVLLLEKKERPTPEEQATRQKLEKDHSDRDRALADLELQRDRTPEQDAKYKELVAMRSQVQQAIVDLTEKTKKQIETQQQELTTGLQAELDAAVAQVAAAKALTIVVQAEVVLFGGLDITDDTLAILNAKAASQPAAAAGANPGG